MPLGPLAREQARIRPEAFDDEIDAQRQLPHRLREGQDGRRPGQLVVGPEQHQQGGQQGQRAGADTELREPPGRQPRAQHQVAEHEAVADGGAESRSEQEGRVMDGHQGPAAEDERRAVGGAAGEVLTQGDEREQADDADRDEGRLDDAQGHVAEREAFVLAPKQREQRDRGPDAGNGRDHFDKRAQLHARVTAGTDDELVVVEHRVIQRQRSDGDERDDEPNARDARGSPVRRFRCLHGGCCEAVPGVNRHGQPPLASKAADPLPRSTCRQPAWRWVPDGPAAALSSGGRAARTDA